MSISTVLACLFFHTTIPAAPSVSASIGINLHHMKHACVQKAHKDPPNSDMSLRHRKMSNASPECHPEQLDIWRSRQHVHQEEAA